MDTYADFFDLPAPSTGDVVFEEIRKVLLGTLKKEIQDELDALRKENEELRPLKADRGQLQRELDRVRSECNRRVREADAAAENRVFESLLGEHIIKAWKVGREYVLPPKCDKCDADRKLHFTSPRGKDMTEPCECAQSKIIFKPVPAILARFRVNSSARAKNQHSDDTFYDKPLYYWYTTEYDTLDGAEFTLSEASEVGAPRASDMQPLSELREWTSVFTDEERCRAFCEYLTEKETNKSVL